MNMVRWLFTGLMVVLLAGCSSSKKEGEACERDSQCDGLLVCYKEKSSDEVGKCMKAGQARELYGKKKEEE
jgi:hypothetical protein